MSEDGYPWQADDIAAELDDPTLRELRHADVMAMRATAATVADAAAGPPVIAAATPQANVAAPGEVPMTVPDFDPDMRTAEYTYMRLADHLAARISVGDLPPGSRLPGERLLADEYHVSLGTVRRARLELESRHLVVTLPAKGTFVRVKRPAKAQ